MNINKLSFWGLAVVVSLSAVALAGCGTATPTAENSTPAGPVGVIADNQVAVDNQTPAVEPELDMDQELNQLDQSMGTVKDSDFDNKDLGDKALGL